MPFFAGSEIIFTRRKWSVRKCATVPSGENVPENVLALQGQKDFSDRANKQSDDFANWIMVPIFKTSNEEVRCFEILITLYTF